MTVYKIRQFAAIFMSCILSAQTYAQQHKTTFQFVETAPENIRNIMQNNANALFDEIHRAYRQNESALSIKNVTAEAEKRIKSIWETSHFYCSKAGICVKRILAQKKSNGALEKYQVRNIPVFFEQGNSDEEQYQEIVIEFTPDGKICDMYNAISIHQYGVIMDGSNEVGDFRQREIILGFVENFKTAYNVKDMNYLQKVYSDDALIITGRVLQNKTGDIPHVRSDKNRDLIYSSESKKQYLDRLGRIFKNNNYVNIQFDEIEVMRNEGNNHIYGVTLKQSWTTKPSEKSAGGYHDDGWLFLLIDYENEDTPTVWVRTWQPLTDGNGNEIGREQVFSTYDFPF
ncbi:MAG: hypothetical protein LBG92_09435 [Prevotellaceae bacterium]|jgi:hypothetical protein|nr:hypothetical protein [Prevotellaceae bacterium]